jgi:hypothetical protein
MSGPLAGRRMVLSENQGIAVRPRTTTSSIKQKKHILVRCCKNPKELAAYLALLASRDAQGRICSYAFISGLIAAIRDWALRQSPPPPNPSDAIVWHGNLEVAPSVPVGSDQCIGGRDVDGHCLRSRTCGSGSGLCSLPKHDTAYQDAPSVDLLKSHLGGGQPQGERAQPQDGAGRHHSSVPVRDGRRATNALSRSPCLTAGLFPKYGRCRELPAKAVVEMMEATVDC